MVMGCLGLLAIQSLPLWRQEPRPIKFLFTGIFGGVMLFVLLGLAPGTDIVAHLGGFASGVLLGAVATQVPDLAQRVKTNLISGLIFALLVIVPWWLALSQALLAAPGGASH
jgi:membrane associated rhomboid family serine protease